MYWCVKMVFMLSYYCNKIPVYWGLNALPGGRLYLCITSGFRQSVAVTFTAKATVMRSFNVVAPTSSISSGRGGYSQTVVSI